MSFVKKGYIENRYSCLYLKILIAMKLVRSYLKYVGWLSSEDKYIDAAVLWKTISSTDWCIYNNEIYIKESVANTIKKHPPFAGIGKVFSWNFYRHGKPHNIDLSA